MSDASSITPTLDVDKLFSAVHGFLSVDEAQLLYRLASEVPAGGRIVEIGNFQGRSTIALALGAKQSGASVYSIDPHDDYQENEETRYGMSDHAALLKNLVDFEVADVVRVITLPSHLAQRAWGWESIQYANQGRSHEFPSTKLLWIDGSHQYDDVWSDIQGWGNTMSLNGLIALHDTSGHYPDVTRALTEFLEDYDWRQVEQVDAIAVLQRVADE